MLGSTLLNRLTPFAPSSLHPCACSRCQDNITTCHVNAHTTAKAHTCWYDENGSSSVHQLCISPRVSRSECHTKSTSSGTVDESTISMWKQLFSLHCENQIMTCSLHPDLSQNQTFILVVVRALTCIATRGYNTVIDGHLLDSSHFHHFLLLDKC